MQVLDKLNEQLIAKRKELTDFQSHYKIRLRSEPDTVDKESKAPPVNKGQGVLA